MYYSHGEVVGGDINGQDFPDELRQTWMILCFVPVFDPKRAMTQDGGRIHKTSYEVDHTVE